MTEIKNSLTVDWGQGRIRHRILRSARKDIAKGDTASAASNIFRVSTVVKVDRTMFEEMDMQYDLEELERMPATH